MADKEPVRFELIEHGGHKTTCTVLFTFHSDEFDRDYIVYSDGNARVSASRYFPDTVDKTDVSTFLPVETDDEWALLERVIQKALG